MAKDEKEIEPYCSFCGKLSIEVEHVISGPAVYICNECIDLCFEILTEKGWKPSKFITKSNIDLKELNIKPRFNKIRFEKRSNHCFYLCPFSEPFNTIYSDHVVPAVKSQDVTIERSDEIFGTQPIIEDIWEGINSASLIIADVTNRNPNVMYEIGMAHTVGKPVIIITQSIDDVPFDLKHYRCIIYEYTPKGCKKLENQLAGTIGFLKGQIL